MININPTKTRTFTSCCHVPNMFCPPSMGDPGFNYCSGCNTADVPTYTVKSTEYNYRIVRKGHWRPVNY